MEVQSTDLHIVVELPLIIIKKNPLCDKSSMDPETQHILGDVKLLGFNRSVVAVSNNGQRE